ncbi:MULTISPECIES: gliding motility lipoprotein GldH [Tenacibaculum]|uniref:gliding motility lipoprotein GldH n=1 Tax=Tenacibaculum TaxID=104267 RepID=UPI0021AE6C8A|nr:MULTISPECIES: gliding motility lipoprotein GldH [Tenacibaculum]MCT4700158.1 gliding motility lipoprotein GldH [Tenacibaculum haliotis]WBX71156.1 gliding motility lipoprotein GldH [Tenacibaculum retecalamus]
MKKNSIYILFLTVFIITSCDAKRVFDEYITLPKNSWNKSNTVAFTFPVKDSINKRNLFINLRNNKDYEYSNLFLIAQINFPDGQVIIDTLEYDMTDVTGEFLGKGLSSIKENKLFYKENIIFPRTGEYTFKINQAMRKNGEIAGIEELKGISEVGFRIEKLQ